MFIINSKTYKIFVFFLLLIGIRATSQAQERIVVTKKLNENAKLFNVNIDKAYLQIDPLLKSVKAIKDSMSELKLLDRKCRYFYAKNRIDSLLKSSEILQQKASQYRDSYSEAMAEIYTAEAYSINKFYSKALHHLDLAYKILDADRSKDSKIFFAKANVLNSYANVYADKGEPRKAVQKLYQVIRSYNELKDPEQVRRFQYLNYSNIASLYLSYDIDSAGYFAKKSIQLESPVNRDEKVMISNYFALGKAYREKKDFAKSLSYYHKSLDISNKIGEKLNVSTIYRNFVEIYKETGQADSVLVYENKLNQSEISELKSKYNSLHQVIDKDQKEESKFKSLSMVLIILGFLSLVGIIVWLIIMVRKRKRKSTVPPEAYNKLLDLLHQNDPAYVFAFEETFPTFSTKLLKINPTLSTSEIEFCSFLKLKLTTKEIAKITLIEPRTVQNKKYRIRKRLNVPTAMDIYNWFDTI